jgi:hypothetical protein
LAAFERVRDALEEEEISLVGASVDSVEKATETRDTTEVSYPLGYGLPLEETAEKLGAFYEVRRQILHATGILMRPDRTVALACYSTGPIGRVVPDDVLRLVRFWKKRAAG